MSSRTATEPKPAPNRLSLLSRNQRKQICQTLLLLGGARGGPRSKTPASVFGPPELSKSSDQKILERIARAFLRASKGVTLLELLQLSPNQLSAVSRLLDTLALGSDAVEWWLNDYAPKGMMRLDPCHRISEAASG
jgi:hypothetical protein